MQVFGDLGLRDPSHDWHRTPLDRVMILHERLRAEESRALSRAIITGQLAMLSMAGEERGKVMGEIVEQAATHAVSHPYVLMSSGGVALPAEHTRVEVLDASVARGLRLAMDAGLLHGDLTSSLPASEGGLPLSQSWEGFMAGLG